MNNDELEWLVKELAKIFQTQIDELKEQIKTIQIDIDDNTNELSNTVKSRYY